MSDPSTPPAQDGGNAAQQAFGKYKTRLAVGPVMMPYAPPPAYAAPPAQGGTSPVNYASLIDSLGTTVKLGFNLLHAAMASGAAALNGVAGLEARMWDQGGAPHGDGCGCDCCDMFDCCRPNVSGCGCGCC